MSDVEEDDDLLEDDSSEIEEEWNDEEEEYGGVETEITRTYSSATELTEYDRMYTEVSSGALKFGYRNANSGTKTVKYTITPTEYLHGGSNSYYGFTCIGSNIKLCQDIYNNTYFLNRIGSSYGATGYLRVVTSIEVTQQYGVDWTIERLPFINGFCVRHP